jgi:Tfp pilus assembly protein PilV
MKRSSKFQSLGARGFTLTEVMVAMSLTMLSMTGSIGLLSWIMQGSAHSGHMTEAVTLGQGGIDDLLEHRYSQISSGNNTTGIYTRTWTVTESGNVKSIDMQVAWKSSRGKARTVSLDTMVAQ